MKGELILQKIYVIISLLFSILSGLPYLFSASEYNFFSIVAFGLNGPVSMFIPAIYACIGLIFALLLNKSNTKLILLICSSSFLFVNLVFALAVSIMPK